MQRPKMRNDAAMDKQTVKVIAILLIVSMVGMVMIGFL